MSRQRRCTIQDLDSKIATECRKYIPPEENVLVCYEWDFGGFLSREFAVYVVTEKQLVFAQNVSRMLGIVSVPLTDIYTVHESKSSSSYQVEANNKKFDFNDKNDADHFAAVLREAIQHVKGIRNSPQGSSQSNAEERFRVLVRLRNDGLITEEEFQQKRKEILGEL